MQFKSASIIDNHSPSPETAPLEQGCLDALDVGSFRDRTGDDESLMCELVELFLADYPRQLEDIRQATRAGNATELGRAAHALKGAVANFSAEPAVRTAARLENMGRTGDVSGAAECCEELANELGRLHVALEKLSGEIRQ